MALQQCISSSYGCFSLRIGAIISSLLLLCLIGSMMFIEYTYMGGTKALQRPGSIVNYLNLNWVYVTLVYLILLIITLLLPMSYIRKFLSLFTYVWIIFALVILSILVTLIVNLINQGWFHLTGSAKISTDPIYYLLVILFGSFTLLSVYLAVILYSYLKQLKIK